MWRNLLLGVEQDGRRSSPVSFQLDHIVASAQFGDLIEFSYPVGYSHWAVYQEDGHVMHFAVAGTKLKGLGLSADTIRQSVIV